MVGMDGSVLGSAQEALAAVRFCSSLHLPGPGAAVCLRGHRFPTFLPKE